MGKTMLSQAANIQCNRLMKHLDWLQGKQIIEFVIKESKICIQLTENGREIAHKIMLLYSIERNGN
jgi:predicted transcriptional regulator